MRGTGASIGLGVELHRRNGLGLYLMGWDQEENEVEPNRLPTVDGWDHVPEAKSWLGLQTVPSQTERLLAKPVAVVEELRVAAVQMVRALQERRFAQA